MVNVQRLPQGLIFRVTAISVDGLTAHHRDEMAVPSYTHWNPLIRWLMWKRYDAIAGFLNTNAKTTALEFGCGMGLFLPTLAARCAEVWAIDLFPQFAQKLAAELGVKAAFVADMSEVPDSKFDYIIAADVMEHLEDPAAYASAFLSKLKPEGKLIVSGPTENFVYKLGRVMAGFAGKGDYHHTNIANLRKLIEASGFKMTRQAVLPSGLLPPLFKIFLFERVPLGAK